MNFVRMNLPEGPKCFATDEPYFTIEPLGHSSLVALTTEPNPELSVVLKRVYETTVDGARLPNLPLVDVTIPFTYQGKANFFGLVPGGWIPPIIGNGRVAMLDRNMVHRLRTLEPRDDKVEPESPEWAYRQFAEASFEVSIATHVLEGKWKREPSLVEMADELATATAKLQAVLPNAKVHQLGEKELRALHALLTERAPLTAKMQQFLIRAAPLLAFSVKRAARRALEEKVLQTADTLGLRRTNLSVIAALSCVYDDPQLPAGDVYRPGRAVLKPKPVYGLEQAHNATADLMALELVVNTHSMLQDYEGVFFTQDVGLAAFWTGLRVQEPVMERTGPSTGRSNVNITFSEELFPTLSEAERSELVGRIVG
jgi:hypothetical protein